MLKQPAQIKRQRQLFKMWDRRKLVLSAAVFIALCNPVSAETREVLDMAPNAVDDQYVGCNEEALQTFIYSGLLNKELNGSEDFQMEWDMKRCSQAIPGGLKEHTAALRAYANQGNNRLVLALDDAMQTTGTNVSTYENDFHFKSLHFLLMDSMRLLSQKKCTTVYDIADTIKDAQKGSNVRFGRFNVVHSSLESLMEVDIVDEVILNITTCFFISLGKSICREDEDLTLLSPVEEFTVENVVDVSGDDASYKMIVLKHSKLNSNHNCYMFSRSPAAVSSQWLVLALLVLPFFL